MRDITGDKTAQCWMVNMDSINGDDCYYGCYYYFYFILIIIIFGHMKCGILVPQPGMETRPPALETQSFNH